jgi:nucleoid-associated protein Lsr2
MAQKVVVELVDDLDGTASDDISTVTFGLDGVRYEIDLTEDNAERLRDALADYVGAARRTGGRIKRATSVSSSVARPSTNREQTKAVRDWARQNGFDLADRGRIPTNVVAAFDQAHAAPAAPKRRSRKKQLAFSS